MLWLPGPVSAEGEQRVSALPEGGKVLPKPEEASPAMKGERERECSVVAVLWVRMGAEPPPPGVRVEPREPVGFSVRMIT